jgi:cytosine/adenosine deaminase-related metal-dependent hydrolase
MKSSNEDGLGAPREDAKLLVRGGRVYDHEGDVHEPPIADVRIAGSRIVAVGADLAPLPGETVLDAAGKLVIPGFVNAHYHSHDVLSKGLVEQLPLEIWSLFSRIGDARGRREEVRTRTLIGAWECLRNGVTTLQDMNNQFPLDEDYLDVVLQAYSDIGIRVVFSSAVQDVSNAQSTPYLCETMPPALFAELAGPALDWKPQVAFVEAQLKRLTPSSRFHWALGPSGPQRCSAAMLEAFAELAERHELPVYTHVLETKWQALEARFNYRRFDGSLVRYLADVGLLGSRLNLVHAVWLRPDEIDLVAQKGGRIVQNPASNLKLKSGISPFLEIRRAGIDVALGCDNTSAGDTQNMFQAMRLYALLAAVSDAELDRPLARETMRAATAGGAATALLGDEIGAIRCGMKADLAILDLGDPAFVPFNSAARQLVYSECGRSVETVIVDGKIVLRDRRLTTIDETELRERVAEVMKRYRRDLDACAQRHTRFRPYLDSAYKRMWEQDVGIGR